MKELNIQPTWRRCVANCWYVLFGRFHRKGVNEEEAFSELMRMAEELDRLHWRCGLTPKNWVCAEEAEKEFGPVSAASRLYLGPDYWRRTINQKEEDKVES